MADFCWQCAEEILGIHPDHNDLKGLVPEGDTLMTLCEGCVVAIVDHTGKCRATKEDGCIKDHGGA